MLDGLTTFEWYEELQYAAEELLAEIDTWDAPQVDEAGVFGTHTSVGHLRYVIATVRRLNDAAYRTVLGPDDQQMNEWNETRNEC